MKRSGIINRIIPVAFILLLVISCTKAPVKDNLSLPYEKYVMPNGMQVILHSDHSDPVISYSIMYHVGSSREVQGKTGFAHLFEHLLFGGSENVEPGRFDKIIESAGGSNNGFTSRDVTTYFEIFPKNALEKVLWLESDRMGFFINSVTQRSLAIQQNVVQNEKRQSEDNEPYGFTNYVISKNLYPSTHPYSWEVIGEMEDLRNATLEDVRSYYNNFYGPNNATLVLAGDFDADTVKALINKYFGEIKSHGEVAARSAMPVSLDRTIKLSHEDNFANTPEITMVWPVPESYNKDSYALTFLADILSEGKKAPMYKVLVKEKELTSRVYAYNNTEELAGEFTVSVTANEGKSLKDIENAIDEAFARFEKDGITEKDIERIKAKSEKSFYQGLNSVLSKSLQLAFYNTYLNDPGFIEKDIENIKAVTAADVKMVYEKYIKGKPHVVTSFVPKGQLNMAAEGSVPAGVREENINEASQVEITGGTNEEVVKSPSVLDRTTEPPAGNDPEVRVPEVWRATLANGIEVYGIDNRELPLVNVIINIGGGASKDRTDLPGVANMVASLLPQGTKNKTPEALEEETELLGSNIRVRAGMEEITMSSDMLSRNFSNTISLMKEMLLEPRWDSTEFTMAKTRIKNSIIQAEAQPVAVANNEFMRLLYGADNIFGYSIRGTRESIEKITPNDLVSFYDKNFSPSVTTIQIAGNISREEALAALKPLEEEWQVKEVSAIDYKLPEENSKPHIYFVDIPGSRQSVICLGYLALTRDNPDFIKAEFINYRLGGAFTSIFNQILREEKGFTYGAFSYFEEMKITAPFIASTSVRSDATFETMKIFIDEMNKYRQGITEQDLQFIKDCMIRSNAMRFETNEDLVYLLSTMSKYGFSSDFIRKDEEVIKNMTVAEHKAITEKYIDPQKMIYVVVGDAATQLKPLEKLGLGKPILVSNR